MTKTVTRHLLTGLPVALLAAAPSIVSGQVEVRSEALVLTVTGRVHTQFNTSSLTNEIDSELLIRRARLTGDVRVSDLVSGRVQPDFGEGKITLKDAYLRLTFGPGLRATIGQFKRPFDRFELTSSTQILVVERTGRIRGLGTCTGPGGICSLSQFTEKLHYSDRDIGVMFDGRDRSTNFHYMFAVTNGTGENTAEENNDKSFTGRVEVTPVTNLSVAGNVGVHDFINPTTGGQNDHAVAFGGDVEWGTFAEGIHLRAGVVAGDNWKNLDAAGDPSTFVTAQGILTYKHRVPPNRIVEAVEPVGRVSWGDPDTDVDNDEGVLVTPGFVIHFTGRNKIGVNVDIWSPGTGDTEWSLKIQSYLHF